MRRAARTALVAAALLASLLPATQSTATDSVVSAAANTFTPANVSVTEGGKLTFANADAVPHNVVSDAKGKTGGNLFRSTVVSIGETADVQGVEKLKKGAYPFYCSLHPFMRGTLTVNARSGAPTLVPTHTGQSVPTPTSVTYFNGALYVTSYAAGTVTELTILPGGLLSAGTPFATGFDSPLGVAFGPDGTMYVADSHDGPDRRLGRVWSVKNGQKAVVIDGLPNGRHNTNNLAVHNGRLYVTNGNATDDGNAANGADPEAPLSGTILSYALPVKLTSKPTVEVRGLRNVYDLAFRPGTNEAWFPTNGPDALDPLGVDLLHKTDVTKATADYGFPACVYADGKNGAPVGPTQSPAYQAAKCRPNAKPVRSLGLHVSANGVAFGPGGVWGNDLYIAEYGSNSPSLQGHRVVRVSPSGGAPQDVVLGSAPLDLTFGPDGLYVVDFASGAITLLRAV
jgi:glucose/arabinose dehydrogenase/plastocyanin